MDDLVGVSRFNQPFSQYRQRIDPQCGRCTSFTVFCLQDAARQQIIPEIFPIRYRQALELLLELLNERYGCKVLRTDSGGVLTNVLLQQGLVDEVSLVVSPCLVGQSSPNVFRSLDLAKWVDMEWLCSDALEGGFVHLMYRVINRS